jgi:hypothetical protein
MEASQVRYYDFLPYNSKFAALISRLSNAAESSELAV